MESSGSGEHEVKDRVWRRLSFFDVIKGELVLRVKCVYYYYVKNDCLKQVPAPSHAGEPLRKKLIKCSLWMVCRLILVTKPTTTYHQINRLRRANPN